MSLGSTSRPIWPDIFFKFHPLRGLYNRGRGILVLHRLRTTLESDDILIKQHSPLGSSMYPNVSPWARASRPRQARSSLPPILPLWSKHGHCWPQGNQSPENKLEPCHPCFAHPLLCSKHGAAAAALANTPGKPVDLAAAAAVTALSGCSVLHCGYRSIKHKEEEGGGRKEVSLTTLHKSTTHLIL